MLFGGSGSAVWSDTWEWDGTSWIQRFPSFSPSERTGHSLVFDSSRNRIVLFGGDYHPDTWELRIARAGGSTCTSNPQCSSGFCVDGVCCASPCGGAAADCQTCNQPGTVGICLPLAALTVCRPAGGACDVTERCTGSAAACPPDEFTPAGTTCADQDRCNGVESCDGLGACLPPADAGLVCDAGAVDGGLDGGAGIDAGLDAGLDAGSGNGGSDAGSAGSDGGSAGGSGGGSGGSGGGGGGEAGMPTGCGCRTTSIDPTLLGLAFVIAQWARRRESARLAPAGVGP